MNEQVNQFKYEDQRGSAKFDQKKKMPRYTYEVYFRVFPSSGEYEAGGQVVLNSTGGVGSVKIGSEISRINHYGEQPACIFETHPHLRKYCFCRDFKGLVDEV